MIFKNADKQLIDAVNSGDLGRAERSLRRGADPNARECIKDLEFGVVPDMTVLMIAAKKGYKDIVKLLLEECRPEIDALSRRGMTALMYASQYGHAEIAILLMQNGAGPNVETENHDRPLDFAVVYRHPSNGISEEYGYSKDSTVFVQRPESWVIVDTLKSFGAEYGHMNNVEIRRTPLADEAEARIVPFRASIRDREAKEMVANGEETYAEIVPLFGGRSI